MPIGSAVTSGSLSVTAPSLVTDGAGGIAVQITPIATPAQVAMAVDIVTG